jgi:hypothetical protein
MAGFLGAWTRGRTMEEPRGAPGTDEVRSGVREGSRDGTMEDVGPPLGIVQPARTTSTATEEGEGDGAAGVVE